MSSSVPAGWEQRPMGELVTLQYGKSPKDVIDDDGDYPIIGTGGITGYSKSYIHEGGTTVVGRKGTINRPSFVDERFWAIDTTYYADEYRGAEPRWYFYNLQNTDLAKYNEASGVPSLNRDTLYSVSLMVPPLPEQKKIASILTSVDEVIGKTESQIAKLQDLKTGMMQELLTKGIGPDGGPHTEFKDSPIGRIPVVWDVMTLGELAVFNSGYAFKSAELSEAGYKVVRISNLHKPSFTYWRYNGPIKATWIVEKGDILFSWAGVANSINVHSYQGEKALLNQHIYNFKFENDETKTWTYQILKSLLPALKLSIEGGAGQLHLTKKFIQDISIPFPPSQERQTIGNVFIALDQRMSRTLEKREHYKRVKKALMQDLLTGKVRVKTD